MMGMQTSMEQKGETENRTNEQRTTSRQDSSVPKGAKGDSIHRNTSLTTLRIP